MIPAPEVVASALPGSMRRLLDTPAAGHLGALHRWHTLTTWSPAPGGGFAPNLPAMLHGMADAAIWAYLDGAGYGSPARSLAGKPA